MTQSAGRSRTRPNWVEYGLVEYGLEVWALGLGPAFLAELGITFVQLSIVLALVARPRLAPYTGVVIGLMLWSFITFETPISGMSMNPARTFGSAVPSGTWTALWVYFVAPPLGMLLAAELRARFSSRAGEHCAKMHHDPRYRCVFCDRAV